MYEDDFGPDANDKLFNELDDFIDFAKDSVKRSEEPDKKFDLRVELMNLVLEEIPESATIRQWAGGIWIAEVKYHNINLICVAGTEIPQLWAEILGDRG